MYKFRLRISLFLVASAILGVSSAVADPAAYPGMMCERLTGGTPSIDSNGHLENLSTTSDMTVLCPVVSPPLIVSTAPAVFVTDANVAENICCHAALKNVTSSVIFGSQSCSTAANAGYQTLTPTVPAAPGTFTHRFYQCGIPNQNGSLPSEIRTYRY